MKRSKSIVSRRLYECAREVNEGLARQNLGAVRCLLSLYYGEHEGRYPAGLGGLLPAFLPSVPTLALPCTKHAPSDRVRVIKKAPSSMASLKRLLRDSGRWTYVGDPKSHLHGTFLIDCRHKDARGRTWSGL
ncbi:MAG: hypothetical protein HYZ75_16490 [Elusimicrobia bacterium]|nr:hypothetical protein [Elusimicrobiota bacterium]